LFATAAVVGSAALAVGGAAVAGAGALAGGGGGAAAGSGSAASAGGAGSSTTTAVASVGSVGTGSSAGGGSVPPPSSPSPGPTASGGGSSRRQPDPPSNGSGDAGSALDPPIARSQPRNATPRGENVSSASPAAQAPPPGSLALSSIGGEPLAAPGSRPNRFSAASRQYGQCERRSRDKRWGPSSPSSVRGATSGDAVAGGSAEAGRSAELCQSRQFRGRVGCCIRGSSAGPASPQPPSTAKGRSALTRAADQVRGFRRRLGSLPSDAAPHATPPRIPIDHED